MIINNTIKNIFVKNKKCIVNADLDGLLSGMILQHFLGWEIVGYSSCCGLPNDEIWMKDDNINLKECVFVDLPVCLKDIFVIDQHFISFDNESIKEYNEENNKINPNVMRNKVFKDKLGNSQYTSKYPFGTVHFIIAILENLNIIDKDFSFNKKIDNFDVADLILRADRVIGNTYSYTRNCLDWANWIISIGGKNTKILFEIVKNEFEIRTRTELYVEKKLQSLGCKENDGDCSNMFRNKDYVGINKYFDYLADSFELEKLPCFEVKNYNRLNGKRYIVNNYKLYNLKQETLKNNMFSFAFVSTKVLSTTYIDIQNNGL